MTDTLSPATTNWADVFPHVEALRNPDLVPPAHLWIPEYSFSAGPEVADLAEMAGLPPDPQQRLILDVVFAERARRPAVFEVDVLAPRRNLKTGTGKMCSLGWLYLLGIGRVLYTAHDWNPACKDMFRDMKNLIDANAWLSKRVRRIYEGNGEESIDFKSGQQMLFKTRTKAGGLGSGNDKLITDEGLELQDAHEDALLPTIATQEQRQNLLLSSAGKRHSATLRGRRDRGRPGGDPTMAWIEYCMPDAAQACDAGEDCDHGKRTRGCGLDKPEMLTRSNPTLSTTRLTLDSLREQRATLSPLGFGREFGGWWDPAPEDDQHDGSPLDVERWGELEDDDVDNAPIPEDVRTFGIEVDLDRAFASIGAAAVREDGRTHLEIVDRRRGVRWLFERCKKLNERGGVVFAIDGGGPAATLADDLEDAGMTVLRLGTGDVAQACADLVDDVNAPDEDLIAHGPDRRLDDAVEGARKRFFRDGGFTFGRRASDVDVTPLLSVAIAKWAHDQDVGPNLW